MKEIIQVNDKPIAAYNADKKELIGIFSNLTLLSKYFRPDQPQNAYSQFHDALKNKRRTKKTIFDFTVTLRTANETQIKLLNGQKAYIAENYPQMTTNQIKGYDSTRGDLYRRMLMKGFQKAEDEKQK